MDHGIITGILRLGSHWQHNDPYHNHKGRCVARVIVGTPENIIRKTFMIDTNIIFLMIMTMSMIGL